MVDKVGEDAQGEAAHAAVGGRNAIDHVTLLCGLRFCRLVKVTSNCRAASELCMVQDRAALDEQKNELIDSLGKKVSAQRPGSLEIGGEVRQSASLLAEAGLAKERAQGLVARTLAQLHGVAERSGGRQTFGVALLVFVLLVALYLLVRFHGAAIGVQLFLGPHAQIGVGRTAADDVASAATVLVQQRAGSSALSTDSDAGATEGSPP